MNTEQIASVKNLYMINNTVNYVSKWGSIQFRQNMRNRSEDTTVPTAKKKGC